MSPFWSTAKNYKCVPRSCSPLEKTKNIVSPNQAVLGENLTIFPLHPYLTLLSSLSPTLENTAPRKYDAGGDCCLFCFPAMHLALSTVTWAPPEGQWSNWILHTSDPCTPSGWPPPATFWPVGGPRSQGWFYQQTLTRLTVGPAGEASSGVLSWAGAEVPFIPFPSLASFPSWRRWTGFTTPVGQLPLAPSWLIIGTLIRKPLRGPFHRDTQLLPGQWALGVQSPPWGSSPWHREVREASWETGPLSFFFFFVGLSQTFLLNLSFFTCKMGLSSLLGWGIQFQGHRRENYMSFWDVQPGDMLKVGVPLFMKKQSSWEILLATNPQPICSQDISITSFCVEVLCPGMGKGSVWQL